MKNKETSKRLSLEDFKLKKFENVNEIEKLLGGVDAIAANCHQISIEDSPLHTNVKYD